MNRKSGLLILAALVCLQHGQAAEPELAHLGSAETQITLAAGADTPRLVELALKGGFGWRNQTPESLIDHAEVNGKKQPLHWVFNRKASRMERTNVTYVYDSPNPHLRLSWEWRAPAPRGPLEHSIKIENLGNQEIWIPLQDSFRFDWHVTRNLSLEQFWVEKGAGTPSSEGTHQVIAGEGYKWTGESSTYAHPRADEPREIIPWLLVERSDGDRSGWYAGIEFSGRTRITLHREGDSVQGVAGLNPLPGPFRTRLPAGATFETPTIFLGAFAGGPDAAGNILRLWVRQVLNNPLTLHNTSYPLLVNNSWGGGMQIDEAMARRMIHDSAELGLEMFHIDAGWFRGVADWYPDPKKFPHGLASVADYAHSLGLKFGLWVDWTQAALDKEPGALNINDPVVRDWLVSDPPPGWKPQPFKGFTIDLGVPAAHDWAAKEVKRIVNDYHLDMLEHDGYLVAQGCDRADHPHAPIDPVDMKRYQDTGSIWVESSNSTDVSYHATRSYYDIYSRLRREHPGLLLEVCNDGGRMVDFGSAAHGDYFSITDTYDPLSNRRAFYDSSFVLPPAMLESYVEKWPVPRIENFRYMLRSGMMGWFTLMLDAAQWTPEQRSEARHAFDLYKSKLRPLIREADLYHVSPRPDGIHWDGIEYFDGNRRDGVLFAFHGSTANETAHTFILRGLRQDRSYRITFQDGSSRDRTFSGRDLMRKGLSVTLPVPNSSELAFIHELSS